MSKRVAHKVSKKKWRSEDIKAEENIDFSALLLNERVLKGLKRAGFKKPSPVQLKAIPLGRSGFDLIVQAKSGTGKTCVFAVVALQGLSDIPNLQVLILAPTREVAHQICCVINSVGSAIPDLACHAFIGGTPVSEDRKKLKDCQIAVGTPGRVKQLIEIKAMMTGCVRLFVLDEADKMIERSFLEDMNWIYNHLPIRKQVIGLSATYPGSLKDLLKNYMRNPVVIRANENELTLKGLMQFYRVFEHNRFSHIVFKRKQEIVWEIINKVSFSQCLIFCNFISRVELLFDWLNEQGYPTAKISSGDSQDERLNTIEQLKLFQYRVLVTSDLTARGVDAENVDLVINLDLPADLETYLHRIGRAGRYGSKGVAITIISSGYEEQKLGEFEDVGDFKVYPLPEPLPENLLFWTLEMVTMAKAENCKLSLDELKAKSFVGSSEDKEKNGHTKNESANSDGSNSSSDNSDSEDDDKSSVISSHHESCSEVVNGASLITQSEECFPAMDKADDNFVPNDSEVERVCNLVPCPNESSVTESESSNMVLLSEGSSSASVTQSYNSICQEPQCKVPDEGLDSGPLMVDSTILIPQPERDVNANSMSTNIETELFCSYEDEKVPHPEQAISIPLSIGMDNTSQIALQENHQNVANYIVGSVVEFDAEMLKTKNVHDALDSNKSELNSCCKGSGDVLSVNTVSFKQEMQKDSEVVHDNDILKYEKPNNESNDDIDKFLLSCCVANKCKSVEVADQCVCSDDISNMFTCFDLNKDKFNECETAFEQIIEGFKSNHSNLEVPFELLDVHKGFNDIHKEFSKEDLFLMWKYIHENKKVYLSSISDIVKPQVIESVNCSKDVYCVDNYHTKVNDIDEVEGQTEKSNEAETYGSGKLNEISSSAENTESKETATVHTNLNLCPDTVAVKAIEIQDTASIPVEEEMKQGACCSAKDEHVDIKNLNSNEYNDVNSKSDCLKISENVVQSIESPSSFVSLVSVENSESQKMKASENCNEEIVSESSSIDLPKMLKQAPTVIYVSEKHKTEKKNKVKHSMKNAMIKDEDIVLEKQECDHESIVNSVSSAGNYPKQLSRHAKQSSEVKFTNKKPVISRRGEGAKLSNRSSRTEAKSSYISGVKKSNIINDHQNARKRSERRCMNSPHTNHKNTDYYNYSNISYSCSHMSDLPVCAWPGVRAIDDIPCHLHSGISNGQISSCSHVCEIHYPSGNNSYFCHCPRCRSTTAFHSPLSYGCGHHNRGLILHEHFMNSITCKKRHQRL